LGWRIKEEKMYRKYFSKREKYIEVIGERSSIFLKNIEA
jgi:hypothetical protein